MPDFAALASIFGVAFLSLWGSIPAGRALGVPPLIVVITAAVSYSVGAALVVFLGQPVRDWLMKRGGDKILGSENNPVRKVWNRYGVIGLGLLAPLTTGSQIGAAVGMALNARPIHLWAWLTFGGLLWAAIIALVIELGLGVVAQ